MGGRSLFVRLAEDPRVLKKAWREVRRNANSYSEGVDGQSVRKFSDDADLNLRRLRAELKSGDFKFGKLKAALIPKESGEYRPIQIATVRDRVVQKGIEMLIRKQLNAKYNLFNNPVSYAFIKTEDILDFNDQNPQTFKGVRGAIEKISKYSKDGFKWALRADIIDFFPNVDRETLLKDKIYTALADDSLNSLIKAAFEQEVEIDKKIKEYATKDDLEKFQVNTGLPQGGILSPLFSNVYLSDFDDTMDRKGFVVVRYVDDFVVLAKNEKDIKEAYVHANKTLGKLGLKIHKLGHEKTQITTSDDFEFLGVRILNGKFYPAAKAFKRMEVKLSKYPRYSNLTKNFQSIQTLTNAWGATYFFCSNDIKKYSELNKSLYYAIERILKKSRLVSTVKLEERQLRRFGIQKFDKSIVKHNNRKNTKLKT